MHYVNTLMTFTCVQMCSIQCCVIVDVCVSLTASECLSPVLPAPVPVSDSCEEDNDLMGDELDSLLDSVARDDDAPPVRNIKQEFI